MNVEHFADGVLIERTVDHGDGTGARTTFHPDGTVDVVEELSGLPIPEPDPEPAVGLAAQVSDLSAQLAAQNATIEALLNALGGTP